MFMGTALSARAAIRRFKGIGALCFIVLLTVTSGDAQPVGGGSISGTVVDSEGIPIAAATVSLIFEIGGCPSTQTGTDANGRFEFPGARPGRYRVEAVRIDYVAQQFGERETGTPGFGATIVLVPSALHREIEIVLDHGSRVTGHVYDEEGKPLSGGYVFFDNPEITSQGFSVRTDVNGAYRALNLPAGNYYVSARRFSVQANQVVGDL
jgi:hypothetical protein